MSDEKIVKALTLSQMAAGEGFLLYCRTDFSVRKEACVRVNLVVAVAERVEVDASALRQGEAVAIVKAGSVELGVDGFLHEVIVVVPVLELGVFADKAHFYIVDRTATVLGHDKFGKSLDGTSAGVFA